MRVPEAWPSERTSDSSCWGVSLPMSGATSCADERRARLQVALGVVEVEAPHGAHGVEPDRRGAAG